MRNRDFRSRRQWQTLCAVVSAAWIVTFGGPTAAEQSKCDAFFATLTDFLEFTYTAARRPADIDSIAESCEVDYSNTQTQNDAVELGMAYFFGNELDKSSDVLSPYIESDERAAVYHALATAEADLDLYVETMTGLAEAGDPRALFLLGIFFKAGPPERRDASLAAEYFRQGAEAGNSNAMSFYGMEFGYGGFYDYDFETELLWNEKAAAAGNGGASYVLAGTYLYGNDVERNCEKASEHAANALKQGFVPDPISSGLWNEDWKRLCAD